MLFANHVVLHPSWPADGLFERVNSKIKSQIEKIEDMTGDMDPKTNFALIVIQTELERYKFLVRSYLRTRIAKVSQSQADVLVHTLQESHTSNTFVFRLINTLSTTSQPKN